MLERAVKRSLMEYLDKIGAYQYWPVPTGYGATTVDCLVCHKGRFAAIECKRPGNYTIAPAQQLVMEAVRSAEGFAFLENDVRLLSTKTLLK